MAVCLGNNLIREVVVGEAKCEREAPMYGDDDLAGSRGFRLLLTCHIGLEQLAS